MGKGTVVRRLLQLDPTLSLSISATTRAPRPGEVHGRDYFFISDTAFDDLIMRGALLEWAELYGRHRSGTPSEAVDLTLAGGRDVVLEIDVQGARTVRDRVPGAVLVFLLPPSRAELERRLRARRSEPEDELRRRLEAADEEVRQAAGFDRVVVNDDVERAASELASIINGYRDAV